MEIIPNRKSWTFLGLLCHTVDDINQFALQNLAISKDFLRPFCINRIIVRTFT